MAELILARFAAPIREEWFGTHLALAPLIPLKHWLPMLARFERVLAWGSGAHLFADSSSGRRLWVPVVGDVRRAFLRIMKDT